MPEKKTWVLTKDGALVNLARAQMVFATAWDEEAFTGFVGWAVIARFPDADEAEGDVVLRKCESEGEVERVMARLGDRLGATRL